MNRDEKHRSGTILKSKKPGPRPTMCIWCNETDCKHCRCMGQIGCNHKKGEMCPNQRYKRRLVCNSCEKNKLREKQQLNALQSSRKKRPKSVSKASRKRAATKVNQEKPSPEKEEPKEVPTKDTERKRIEVINELAAVSVYLQGTNELVLSFHLNDLNATLSSIRPLLLQKLKSTSPDTNIAFVKNEALIPFDSESSVRIIDVVCRETTNNSISHPLGGSSALWIHMIREPPTQPEHPPYMYAPVVPSLYSAPQSFPSFDVRPVSQVLPSVMPAAPNPMDDHLMGMRYSDTPLQRLLNHAAETGRLEQVLQQPGLPVDFGLDDTPRDLGTHSSSLFHFGSFDALHSRSGSMLFPPGSKPGSMILNPFGSNQSIDYKDISGPFDELFSRYLGDADEGGIDKDAPSL